MWSTWHSQEVRGKVRTVAVGIPAYAADIRVARSAGAVHTLVTTIVYVYSPFQCLKICFYNEISDEQKSS